MVSEKYLQKIGLNDEQIMQITNVMQKESRYRRLMYDAGIMPSVIEKLMSVTELSDADLSNEALTVEKIRAEWPDMIKSEKQS